MNNSFELDAVDFQILNVFQENAKISNAELSRELGMAPSGVLERVKKLEQKGVIKGYTIQINPLALDQKLLAFISIKTSDAFGSEVTGLALAKIPEIQEVHNVTGEDCFLIKIRVRDSEHLMDIMRHSFSKIKGIVSTKTIIVLEAVKETNHLNIQKN